MLTVQGPHVVVHGLRLPFSPGNRNGWDCSPGASSSLNMPPQLGLWVKQLHTLIPAQEGSLTVLRVLPGSHHG